MTRIRSMLLRLISPLQTSFVPRRKGVDNAIIVQELIYSMSKKKERNGVMSIKIDLEKAYDRLEWSFIKDMISLFKFPKDLITLIMVVSLLLQLLFSSIGKPWNHSSCLRVLDRETLFLPIYSFFAWRCWGC